MDEGSLWRSSGRTVFEELGKGDVEVKVVVLEGGALFFLGVPLKERSTRARTVRTLTSKHNPGADQKDEEQVKLTTNSTEEPDQFCVGHYLFSRKICRRIIFETPAKKRVPTPFRSALPRTACSMGPSSAGQPMELRERTLEGGRREDKERHNVGH